MHNYLNLLQDILDNGHTHEDRTGVGRRSVFGREMRFDLSDGQFPLVTTRKIFTRGMIEETLWFLSGSTDALALEAKGVNIWSQWTPTEEDAGALADKLLQAEMPLALGKPPYKQAYMKMFESRIGTIGPLYGAAFRGNYDAGNGLKGPDQITNLIEGLKTNPYGSRHCVSAWLPQFLPLSGYSPKENALLGQGALAPCHCFFQCFVTPAKEEGDKLRLSLKLQLRSADVPIGTPYNTAQYALLLMLFAQCTGMQAHELIVSIGDAHIYSDQIDLAMAQVIRKPYPSPTLVINPDKTDIFSFTIDDFELRAYQSHPVIKYPVAM